MLSGDFDRLQKHSRRSGQLQQGLGHGQRKSSPIVPLFALVLFTMGMLAFLARTPSSDEMAAAADRWQNLQHMQKGGRQIDQAGMSGLVDWLLEDAFAGLARRRDSMLAARDECGEALQLPRVALLFLSRGELFQEPTWRLWFQSAAGEIPMRRLQRAACSAEGHLVLPAACLDGHSDVLRSQHLFSVYIHTSKKYKGFPEDSMFQGYELQKRIKVHWGGHDLIVATRLLLRQALQNPLNERFVLLSEADVPLYPPSVIYMQLMTEQRSRVCACQMHFTGEPPQFVVEAGLRSSWRKTSQWFGLHRELAQDVVDDTFLDGLFQRHCYTSSRGQCYSDENYIGTLLALLGKENRTDCLGFMTHVNWNGVDVSGGHPSSYLPEEVTSSKLRALRREVPTCRDTSAIKRARAHLVEASAATDADCEARVPPYSPIVLPRECPLFARKFPATTAERLAKVVKESCRNGLHIYDKERCAVE